MLFDTALTSRFARPFAALIVATGLASTADAQCFVSDQLDSAPCCTPVDVNVPLPPPNSLQASGFCWDSCGLVDQNCLRVQWQPIEFTPNCSRYVTKIEVLDCSGVALMAGELQLDYTRTWNESSFGGGNPDLQVWRYVAKVDFNGDFAATPVCPVPPDLGPYPTSFWYGYFDFARNCFSGDVENALVLFHNCDAFTHHPTLSSQPGTFHPTETYAIVAPDTPANPFAPVSMPLSPGLIMGEAIRSTASPIAGACLAEEPVVQGALSPLGVGCLCPLSLTTFMNTASAISAAAACGGGFNSLNLFPTTPWFDFTTTSIGTWTTGARYPGEEVVHVGEGLFLYRDVCTSTGVTTQSLDVFYGGITEKGYPVINLGVAAPLTDRFVDLASNYSSPLPGPVATPLFGTVAGTRHLIYVNL